MSKFLARASSIHFDTAPEYRMDEDKMLDLLVEYVKKNKIRVSSPDYFKTRMYSAQWKNIGPVYWWQSPQGGIPAVMNQKTEECWFKEAGFNKI